MGIQELSITFKLLNWVTRCKSVFDLRYKSMDKEQVGKKNQEIMLGLRQLDTEFWDLNEWLGLNL